MSNRIDSIRNKLKIYLPDVSVSYINSTCPECFGWISILNTHKCSEGWNNTKHLTENEVFNIMKEKYEFPDRVKVITNKLSPESITQLIENLNKVEELNNE